MTVNLREYNTRRVYNAFRRRITDRMMWIWWELNPRVARENEKKIVQFKDRYKGQRCFVLGNGPSLKKTDLLKLKGEVCFGSNRIYLIKEQVDFSPSFLTSIDEQLLEQFHEEISVQPVPKFINWKYYRYFEEGEDICFLKIACKKGFAKDMTGLCGGGFTVTFVNLQLAFYMGFSEVILIGCDHSYAEKGVPNIDVKVNSVDQNHFSEKYYTKNHTFRIPDYVKQEQAYATAKSAFEADGRSVVDATIGGKLEVFEKVDFNSLF